MGKIWSNQRILPELFRAPAQSRKLWGVGDVPFGQLLGKILGVVCW